MATTDQRIPAHASNVYLFKNGYGMIVKTFEFPSSEKNNGKPLELLNPPKDPVHGTFWVQSLSNNTSITAINTKRTQKFVTQECCSVEDLLEANIGQDVELLFTDNSSKNAEWISGKIKLVKRSPPVYKDDDDDSNAIAMDTEPAACFAQTTTAVPFSVSQSTNFTSSRQIGNLILLETVNHGLLAVLPSNVQSIRGASLKTTYQRKVDTNCLSINYINKSESSDVGFMRYLTYGITWAPSYNLVLLTSDDPSIKRLRLSSKAVIINDIENMKVDNLFCIVGFPNISKFSSVADPFLSGESVKTFLSRLSECEAGRTTARQYGNQSVMLNSVMMQQAVMPMSSNINNTPDDSQQDAHNDDLDLYEFKNISLLKKERLMLPIFDVEIPYKDVYHCKIDSPQSTSYYYAQNEKKDFEDVWHSVEFENISNFVWTTAPIVITKGQLEQQFIAQDKLTYTLKGSTTFVNLTKALDVRVQLDEKVINTSTARIAMLKANYQTDEIDGKIIIMNYKSEEIQVVIDLTLLGKITRYSTVPKKDVMKSDYDVANQRHEIQWGVNIKSKETLEIKYTRFFSKRV